MDNESEQTGKPLWLYRKLLLLYPKHYRDEYADQLMLTTADMLADVTSDGERRCLWFRVFSDLFMTVGKEHYAGLDEILNNGKRSAEMIKALKAKLLITAGVISLFGIIATAALLLDNHQAPAIMPMSSLEQAEALSADEEDACIADNQQAIAAVKKDDTMFEYAGKQFSMFEQTASRGIMDVPAGTNYTVSIGSYDGSVAKGAILYEREYGTYNYSIKKLAGASEWEFVSMTACSDDIEVS